jgi:hypothetical protein
VQETDWFSKIRTKPFEWPANKKVRMERFVYIFFAKSAPLLTQQGRSSSRCYGRKETFSGKK